MSSAHTDECYSAAGTGAFSYSATGVGGWAGVPIIVSGTFAEQNLKFQGSYVIYDANADANATTWGDYTSDLDGFLNTWNDLLPALTNWEAQSAAYEADYVAWQTSANTTLQQGAAAYEAGVTELVNERSKWASQMENIYREGENDWLVIRKELEKKKKLYRQELENEGLGEADLERELNRRSMEALSKMTMPSRPGARNAALETTVRAHNKFGEIKDNTLIAAERVDSSRMEEILSQFDKSINGALNTAVMETLNQAAIDSRQGMVDQMSDVLGNGLGKSVQQAFHYNEALDKARGNLEITDAMFEKGFEGLDEATKEKLNTEIERIFKDEYLDDEGFRVTRNENGNIKVTRMVPTGGTIQLPGTDGTKPEHYKPEMREESFVVVDPAAMKLVETDGIFAAWDLQKVLGDFGKATDSYHEGSGDDVNKILKDTIKTQGDVLNDRIESYHANMQKRMETAQMVKSIVESMITGGQDFKSAATNYVEGQVRGQIAGAVAEATGLPSEFISGLMGGQKPHEAVMSMAENAAWANFEQAAGIEGVSSLMRTALSGERSRRAEKKSKQLRVEDFATMGTTYAVRNQQYSGGLQTMLSMANVATGFMFTPMQNAYQSSLTEQGGAAFRSLVNGTLNGLTGNATTLATALTRGEAPNQSQLQSLTGLPAEYFERLPGKLKAASDRTDIYGRLGTRHLGRWVDRVVDEGTQFGQDLASGKYFAGAIGGEFGDTLRRRNSVDFATAEDLTNAMFNPLDYIIKPMYDAVGMSRTYDNFWAPYKKMTRSVREDMRDALAKNPAALDVTAFAAANATGCMQCYYGYAWQKGWNQGGNKGAVAEVGTVALKGLGAMALGPAALSGGPAGLVTVETLMASLDAGASYSYENGWDVKLGLADPSGKLSAGLTYSDQNGAGVYANVAATKSEHGASLGFTYTEGGGLSLNAGAKRDKINVGVSYSASNGFGMNGGFSEQAGTSGKAGATFGLSQRGGWNVGTNFSAAGMDGLGIDMGYYNRPGQRGGFTAGIDYNGLTLEHDLTSGQSTVGDFSKLIRSEIAAQRERKLLKERLLEIAKRTKEIYSETQWLNMSREEQEKVLKRVEEKAKANSDGTEGESYDRDGGLLGDLLNAAKDGLVGMFGGISDEFGYVDAQGKYHTRTCFVAGTLVVTENGFRPIEELKAGDVVLSWNEGSGELGYNKVAQTFVRTTELIYQITYEDGTFLETTWNHPFYIKGRGWVKAKDLRDGDLSFTSSSIRGDSRELKVTSVFVDEREDRVYNFEVNRDHTYFVTGMGVLVHNEAQYRTGNLNLRLLWSKDERIKEKIKNLKKLNYSQADAETIAHAEESALQAGIKETFKEYYIESLKDGACMALVVASPVMGASCIRGRLSANDTEAINKEAKKLLKIAKDAGYENNELFLAALASHYSDTRVATMLLITAADMMLPGGGGKAKAGKLLVKGTKFGDKSRKLLAIMKNLRRKLPKKSPTGTLVKNGKTTQVYKLADGKVLPKGSRVLKLRDGKIYITDGKNRYVVTKYGKIEKACFEAGTKIHTEDGLRNIEDIKVGDLVYSRLKPGGKPVLKKVLNTFIRKVSMTLALTFAAVGPGLEAGPGVSLPGETWSENTAAQVDYTEIDHEEVTPETWRSINLEIRKADGSIARVDLLRPLWWLEEAGAKVGGTIYLSMPEMGIDGDARVLKIEPNTTDSRKAGSGSRVVTGTFVHENAVLLDLYFNYNSNESLGVTPNHPIWSQTRNGWVQARNLEVGEYVKTREGVARLTGRKQRAGRHTVYNLEVHKDHTYFVSGLKILVHNTCQEDFVRVNRNRQVANDINANRIFKMTDDELAFVERIRSEKPNLQIYRTNQKDRLGDFLIIDRSNPKKPMAFLVDLKSGGGGAGNQLSNSAAIKDVFKIDNIKKLSGTADDLLKEMSRGRAAFP